VTGRLGFESRQGRKDFPRHHKLQNVCGTLQAVFSLWTRVPVGYKVVGTWSRPVSLLMPKLRSRRECSIYFQGVLPDTGITSFTFTYEISSSIIEKNGWPCVPYGDLIALYCDCKYRIYQELCYFPSSSSIRFVVNSSYCTVSSR
jgi:hypothetical protein